MNLKVILTGATGMVGEGEVLSVSRRYCGHQHPKLKECIIPDFLQLDVDEADYTRITFDTPLHFAQQLLSEVGQAMINSVTKGYPRQILEIKDIKTLATL